MKTLMIIIAMFAISSASAQTRNDSIKKDIEKRTAEKYEVDSSKTAEATAKIKKRSVEEKKKTIRKYKGKNSDSTTSKSETKTQMPAVRDAEK